MAAESSDDRPGSAVATATQVWVPLVLAEQSTSTVRLSPGPRLSRLNSATGPWAYSRPSLSTALSLTCSAGASPGLVTTSVTGAGSPATAVLGADTFSCSFGSRTSNRAVDEPVKLTNAWQARLPLAVGTIWMSSRFSWPGSRVPRFHMSNSPSICAFGSVACTVAPPGMRV